MVSLRYLNRSFVSNFLLWVIALLLIHPDKASAVIFSVFAEGGYASGLGYAKQQPATKYNYTGQQVGAGLSVPSTWNHVPGISYLFVQQMQLKSVYKEPSKDAGNAPGRETISLTGAGLGYGVTSHGFEARLSLGGVIGSAEQSGDTPLTQTFSPGIFGNLSVGIGPFGPSGLFIRAIYQAAVISGGSETGNPDKKLGAMQFDTAIALLGYNMGV